MTTGHTARDEGSSELVGPVLPVWARPERAAAITGNTRTRLYELGAKGLVTVRKDGRATLFNVPSILAWMQNLPLAELRLPKTLVNQRARVEAVLRNAGSAMPKKAMQMSGGLKPLPSPGTSIQPDASTPDPSAES